MTFLCAFAMGIMLLNIGLQWWAWYILKNNVEVQKQPMEELPAVVIFLPARNEEVHLPGCLQSLMELDYPREKLLVFIGNDASVDRTEEIAREWSLLYPNVKYLNIKENLGKARGKANVLAQLARACPATITYFFITDADIRPHPQWIRRMLQAMQPGVGLVIGSTLIWGPKLFHRWQQTDWAIALGLAKAYSYLPRIGRTLTAMGNNMLISRQAYEATGGYENIPFSITEDLELLQQVRQRGFTSLHLMDEQSSALSEPIGNLKELLNQRRRWLTGAMRLPKPLIILLVLQSFFLPAAFLVLLVWPFAGFFFLLLKLWTQHLLVKGVLKRIGTQQFPKAGIFYECYAFVLNTLLIVFYYLPIKITWKDRDYRSNRH